LVCYVNTIPCKGTRAVHIKDNSHLHFLTAAQILLVFAMQMPL